MKNYFALLIFSILLYTCNKSEILIAKNGTEVKVNQLNKVKVLTDFPDEYLIVSIDNGDITRTPDYYEIIPDKIGKCIISFEFTQIGHMDLPDDFVFKQIELNVVE